VIVLYGYSLLALIHLMKQEGKAALATIAEAERLMQRWQVSEQVYQGWIAIVKANIWMALDKQERAEECLSRVNDIDGPTGINHAELFPMQSGLYQLTCVRLLLQKKDYTKVIQLLDSIDLKAQAGIIQLLATLFKAAAFALKHESAKAKQIWQQGLELAQREKIQLDIGKFISLNIQDLESIIDSTWRATEITQVVSCHEDKGHKVDEASAPAMAPAFIEASNLSAREHEVLGLIAKGYSNQSIADQLFISLHTVKTHARKINAKLGAKSRTQAIVKAQEQMII
jgi:LuxR family maltose regulon positive regulatory protein